MIVLPANIDHAKPQRALAHVRVAIDEDVIVGPVPLERCRFDSPRDVRVSVVFAERLRNFGGKFGVPFRDIL